MVRILPGPEKTILYSLYCIETTTIGKSHPTLIQDKIADAHTMEPIFKVPTMYRRRSKVGCVFSLVENKPFSSWTVKFFLKFIFYF